MVDRQDAAGIAGLCTQRRGTEGVALCGAGDAHLVVLPVYLQHAGWYIGGEWIAAVGAGGAFKPMRGLQEGRTGLTTLAAQHQALVAGPCQAGKQSHAGEGDEQFGEGEALLMVRACHVSSVVQHMPAVPLACDGCGCVARPNGLQYGAAVGHDAVSHDGDAVHKDVRVGLWKNFDPIPSRVVPIGCICRADSNGCGGLCFPVTGLGGTGIERMRCANASAAGVRAQALTQHVVLNHRVGKERVGLCGVACGVARVGRGFAVVVCCAQDVDQGNG